MATMTIAEAEKILDIVYSALQDTSHRHHPVSALKGNDIYQICAALKLQIANEFLLLAHRDDFDQQFAEGLRLYDGIPWIIVTTFVADDLVDERFAEGVFNLIEPSTMDFKDERFASEETGTSFGDYCKNIGPNDPNYWRKIYARVGLEYTAGSPKANDPVRSGDPLISEPVDQEDMAEEKSKQETARDLMAEYDRLYSTHIAVTGPISHDEFVAGMKDKTLGFKVRGEPYTLLRGSRKAVFNILVMLYVIGPLVIIPLWAYHEGNWWLLIGIAVSYATSFIATWVGARGRNSIGGFLVLSSLVCWWIEGLHSSPTLFLLSGLWGFMFFHIAEAAQREYAMQVLLESREVFEEAVDQEKIMIVRRNDEFMSEGEIA